MTARDHAAFDGGADFVSDPAGLSGRWFDDWEALLNHRLDRADLVAIVDVTSVALSGSGGDAETVSLVVEPVSVLTGSWPDDITLVSTDGDTGRASVARSESRLLEGPLMLFVKWAAKGGDVVPRWHLAPAEGAVAHAAEVQFRGASDTRVVRHIN